MDAKTPSIDQAVIWMPPAADYEASLLQRRIAGIPLFKRLLLTLQRSGIGELVVLCSGESPENTRIERDIRGDFRFQSRLLWVDADPGEGGKMEIFSRSEPRGVLLVEANLVTTANTLQEFIRRAQETGALEQNRIASLKPNHRIAGGMHLFPAGKTYLLEQVARREAVAEPVETIALGGERHLSLLVKDGASARLAEKTLIHRHKFHYTQFMDVWFNRFFSLRISAFLVKTPVTPNQVTLFGLVIGLVAGYFFSRGDYLGQVLGGFFLVVTAIWDCCDGDVARLKMMESDFGETLDTICDNIINVFVFTGMMIGVVNTGGIWQGLIPFLLLAIGGTAIFVLIYFPKGGKGEFFNGTWFYEVIQVLAARNFIYVVLIFALVGKINWFLWLAGIGSTLFALALFVMKRKILAAGMGNSHREIQDVRSSQ